MDILLLITKFRQQKTYLLTVIKDMSFCKYILLFQSFCTDSLYIWLRKNRNKQKVYTFLKRLFKHFGEPKFLVTDKTPSIVCAFRKLQNNVFIIRQNIEQ